MDWNPAVGAGREVLFIHSDEAGEAVVRAIAAQGASVMIADIQEELGARIVDDYPKQVLFQRTMAILARGVFLGIKHAAKAMLASGTCGAVR